MALRPSLENASRSSINVPICRADLEIVARKRRLSSSSVVSANDFDGGPPATDDTLARLHFNGGSVTGQGLGAFNVYGVDITVEGGAQDGVAKTMLGGKVAVMKGKNKQGRTPRDEVPGKPLGRVEILFGPERDSCVAQPVWAYIL